MTPLLPQVNLIVVALRRSRRWLRKNATVTITVNGSGEIQTTTIVAGGQGYKVGDVLTITDATVFGSGDTAPVLTVATVS